MKFLRLPTSLLLAFSLMLPAAALARPEADGDNDDVKPRKHIPAPKARLEPDGDDNAVTPPRTIAPAPPARAIEPDGDDDDQPQSDIVVSAKRLDDARDLIQTSVGASEYRITREDLDIQPGGADRSLKGVLLQAPGVAQDADGDGDDIHIRNEHGNIQFRLNGVIVPQAQGNIATLVDARVAASVDVLTGALPAQFGLHTSGIISLRTRTDSFDFDGDIGIYGGSNGTIQPSATLRDSIGRINYFVSGSYLRNDLGFSNPTASRQTIHDRTEQEHGFGYLSWLVDNTNRLTLFGGSSSASFQIPNIPGIAPVYSLRGRPTFDSAQLDQNQHLQTHYGVLAYQYSGSIFDVQFAPFLRYTSVHVTPDPSGGRLIFDGADTDLRQSSLAWGAQVDASLKASPNHTIRFGLYFQHEHSTSDSINRVFALAPRGVQASDVPLVIPVRESVTATTFSAYLQDEWRLADSLTLNYGLRYDRFVGLTHEDQVSPRVGLVWKQEGGTTVHLGYARYFTPPPLELVGISTLAAFAGTTGAPASLGRDPVRTERENSFDIGAQQIVARHLTLGIDVYYKIKRNLLDEETLGATRISSPFNYANSRGWGVEFSANFEHEPFEAYVNVAHGEQKARQIVSNQFFFEQDELDYIARNYIYSDHSQKWTASGGAALKSGNRLGQFQASLDFVYGDGLRKADPAGIVPNGGKQNSYLQVNLGLAQRIGGEEENWTLRCDVTNLFDKTYLIHDGSGVGAGQAEYGPRRAVFFGVRKSF